MSKEVEFSLHHSAGPAGAGQAVALAGGYTSTWLHVQAGSVRIAGWIWKDPLTLGGAPGRVCMLILHPDHRGCDIA